MCDCISNAKAKFLEYATKEGAKQGWTILDYPSPELENCAIFFQKKDKTIDVAPIQLSTQFTYSYTFEKKDKTTSRPKNEKIHISFSFCPFCGEEYQRKIDAQNDERSVATEAKSE